MGYREIVVSSICPNSGITRQLTGSLSQPWSFTIYILIYVVHEFTLKHRCTFFKSDIFVKWNAGKVFSLQGMLSDIIEPSELKD